MHREEVGAAPDESEGNVQVPVRQVVAGIAEDDGRDRARRRGVRLVGREQALALELASGIRRGQDEDRATRMARRGIGSRGRGPGDDPIRVDGQATPPEPIGEGLAVELREVGDDPERDAARS